MVKPLVSVVVPCYNHEQFVEAAIRSVAAQDYPRVEVIFIDDFSTDGSLEISTQTLEQPEIGSQLEAVRVIRNERNLGAAKTINEGLSWANGEYLAILNSDDLYGPTRLSRIIAEMDLAHTGLGFSRVVPINRTGSRMPWDALPATLRFLHDQDRVESDFPAVSFGFFAQNIAASSGNFLFTRKIWDAAGPFRDLPCRRGDCSSAAGGAGGLSWPHRSGHPQGGGNRPRTGADTSQPRTQQWRAIPRWHALWF